MLSKRFLERAKGHRGDRKAPISNRPQNRRFCRARNLMGDDCIACGLCGDVLRRPRGLGGDFEFLPLKSPRNPITPFETSSVSTLHPELYKNLREGARRVIGATAKPLYPIDGKAEGLDRRSPQTSLFEGGGPSADGGRSKQAVEGVFSRRKAYSFPKLKYMRQNAEPCACLRRILLILYLIRRGQSMSLPF